MPLDERSYGLTDDIFHAITAMIPQLIYIAKEECGVDPIELLVLWHIRHFGRRNHENQSTILRHDLTDVLGSKFRYSDTDVSRLIEDLQEKELISRTSLTARQRSELFGATSGGKLIVVLNGQGEAKLEQFKGCIRGRYDSWIGQQPTPIQIATKAFLPIGAKFAQWLVEQFQTDEGRIQKSKP